MHMVSPKLLSDRSNLHRWVLMNSAVCECWQQRIMNHIVEMWCLLAKFESGWKSLREVTSASILFFG